jgi:YD repeat-containing protein
MFSVADALGKQHRLTAIEDRHRNRIALSYDDKGRLSEVRDSRLPAREHRPGAGVAQSARRPRDSARPPLRLSGDPRGRGARFRALASTSRVGARGYCPGLRRGVPAEACSASRVAFGPPIRSLSSGRAVAPGAGRREGQRAGHIGSSRWCAVKWYWT